MNEHEQTNIDRQTVVEAANQIDSAFERCRRIVEEARRGDSEAIADLSRILNAWTTLPWFSIVTGSKQQALCQMPNNPHFINTPKMRKCKGPKTHTFCDAHALSYCPICNNTVQ